VDDVIPLSVVATPLSALGNIPTFDQLWIFGRRRQRFAFRLRGGGGWRRCARPSFIMLPPIHFASYANCGSTGDVLRATWLDIPLVAKIVATVDKSPVGHEAIAYVGYLAHLRGVIVPEFLGLYRSEEREYVGEHVEEIAREDEKYSENDEPYVYRRWNLLNESERFVHGSFFVRSYRTLANVGVARILGVYCGAFLIHMAGVWHGDLRERNVIKGHRGLRIVDFSHAGLHDCPGPDCDELDLLQFSFIAQRASQKFRTGEQCPWWRDRIVVCNQQKRGVRRNVTRTRTSPSTKMIFLACFLDPFIPFEIGLCKASVG
jgi:hypothetical protein